MVQASIHFPNDRVTVEFDSETAFLNWLGYLKEHGLATVKLAGTNRSVIVFKNNLTYIEPEGDTSKLALG